jgi:hypothetical protein
MEEHTEVHTKINGELIAELLDQDEYHSNIGEVAVVSTEQLCVLRRVHHELVPFSLEYLDINTCQSIEYIKETAYYRIVVAVLSIAAMLAIAYMLAIDPNRFSAENGPLIVACVGLLTFGIRFGGSTHRHILRFQMPDELLTWRSPATDYQLKAEAAQSVRNYAQQRGILK